MQLMEHGIMDESGTTPGKTIVFCASEKHAQAMKRLLDECIPNTPGRLGEVCPTRWRGCMGRAASWTSSRTRTSLESPSASTCWTLVDVREVVNLVFAKRVRSWIKFHQMIGRGTRVLDDDCISEEALVQGEGGVPDNRLLGQLRVLRRESHGKHRLQLDAHAGRLFKARLDRLRSAIENSDARTAVAMRTGSGDKSRSCRRTA